MGIRYQESSIRKTNGGIWENFARNLNSFLCVSGIRNQVSGKQTVGFGKISQEI